MSQSTGREKKKLIRQAEDTIRPVEKEIPSDPEWLKRAYATGLFEPPVSIINERDEMIFSTHMKLKKLAKGPIESVRK